MSVFSGHRVKSSLKPLAQDGCTSSGEGEGWRNGGEQNGRGPVFLPITPTNVGEFFVFSQTMHLTYYLHTIPRTKSTQNDGRTKRKVSFAYIRLSLLFFFARIYFLKSFFGFFLFFIFVCICFCFFFPFVAITSISFY